MAKVSVIVPVYNVENYIEKCLKSLVNQTLDDLEIIVVNDGSTDKSKEKIIEFFGANLTSTEDEKIRDNKIIYKKIDDKEVNKKTINENTIKDEKIKEKAKKIEEIKELTLKFENKTIKYLEKENGGLSSARNFGMKYAIRRIYSLFRLR